MACLANLAPSDADEAKALLPRQVYAIVNLDIRLVCIENEGSEISQILYTEITV